jgi:hypothetical protein
MAYWTHLKMLDRCGYMLEQGEHFVLFGYKVNCLFSGKQIVSPSLCRPTGVAATTTTTTMRAIMITLAFCRTEPRMTMRTMIQLSTSTITTASTAFPTAAKPKGTQTSTSITAATTTTMTTTTAVMTTVEQATLLKQCTENGECCIEIIDALESTLL